MRALHTLVRISLLWFDQADITAEWIELLLIQCLSKHNGWDGRVHLQLCLLYLFEVQHQFNNQVHSVTSSESQHEIETHTSFCFALHCVWGANRTSHRGLYGSKPDGNVLVQVVQRVPPFWIAFGVGILLPQYLHYIVLQELSTQYGNPTGTKKRLHQILFQLHHGQLSYLVGIGY